MTALLSSNPARLDRRVTLRSPSEARDAAGGTTTTWTDTATVWAEWTPQGGRELQQAGQKLALGGGTLRIRYRPGLTARHRVVLDGSVYELTAPPIEVGRRVYLDLVVQALNPAATP